MALRHTKKSLKEVGFFLKKKLQDELKRQKHVATGKLSRGIRPSIIGRHELADFSNLTLSMISSVSYWKAVNNPKAAKEPNKIAIKKWVAVKGLPATAAVPIFRKLKDNYGKPYVVWKEGNTLDRTDFAGRVANKFSEQVADKLAPSIGRDVADKIGKEFGSKGKGVIIGGKGFIKAI